jgi:hypothetical protein
MYTVLLLVIIIIVFYLQARASTNRDKIFVKVAGNIGLTPRENDPQRHANDGFSGIFAKVQLPKDRGVLCGPIVQGTFDGWELVLWIFSYNSNPNVSHTGPGFRMDFFAVALSSPSRLLPSFRSDAKQNVFENMGQGNLSELTLAELKRRRQTGCSVQCDGRWLLVEGPGRLTPLASELQPFITFANSITRR